MDDAGCSAILVLVGLGLFSFCYLFCAAARIALTRSTTGELEELQEDSYLGSTAAMVILSRADSCLLGCRLAMHVLAVLNGALLAAWILFLCTVDKLIGPTAGFAESLLVLLIIAVFFSALIQALVQYVKALVAQSPERALCWLAYPLTFIEKALIPLVWVVRVMSHPLLKAGRLTQPFEREMVVSAEGISEIVEMSGEAGELESDEYEMIQGVFELSERLTREVMTARNDVVAVPSSASLEEVVKVFVEEGLSRILVYGDNLDDVKGILMAKDLMPFVGEAANGFDVSTLVREPLMVPGTRKLGDLLHEFRVNAVHIAVVLDEHGGMDGVITVEDLLEEIVGDIFDEYDIPEEEAEYTETVSGDLLVDGSALLSELNEEYSFDFPDGEYDTVAGFLIHLCGRIPEEGELVSYDGYEIKVENVVQNRITLVRILKRLNSEPQ